MATPPPTLSPIKERVMPEISDNVTVDQLHEIAELPSEFKKGWRTSEFWQSAVATLIPVMTFGASLFGYDVDTELLLASLGGLIPNASYVVGRSWLKRKRIDGMVS